MKSAALLRFMIISLICLLISSNITYSQNRFGLLAGAGMSKEGNSIFSTSFKPAFEIDGIYNIDFKNYLDLRMVLGYKLRGYRDEITYPSSGVTDIDKTSYHLITFGPDFIFHVYQEKHKIYLLAGLRGNYLVAYSYTSDYSEDYPALLDKLQLEADIGMGWSLKSGVFIEGVFSGNCLNKENKNKEPDFLAYDFYLGLSAGYNFKPKHKDL
jgi:hypothetical protein